MPLASQANCSSRLSNGWGCNRAVIETEQSATVGAAIVEVWDYVQDIARWAAIMPGYQASEIVDENTSRWTLKVGVGGLVRTVKVLVTVDAWNGPGEVRFSYKLAGDPVQGSGTYTASTTGAAQTEITLRVNVAGSGPMAPMWEAMGKPLLPTFARGFADRLAAEIEKAVGYAPLTGPAQPSSTGLLAWLRSLWNKLFKRENSR